MISATHKLIGMSIISNLEKNFNTILDKESFLNGCVKPDYSLSFLFIPHYKEKSFDFVINIIKELLYIEIYNKNSKIFFNKIGIVVHFLCDYFCFAHNTSELDFIIPHLKYEKALHKLFKNNQFDILNQNIPNTFEVYSLSHLIEEIDDRYKSYNSSPPSMEKDIYYAVEISNITCNFIIKNVLNNKNYNVA